MAMTRSASATWQGDLPTGEGTVSTASDFLQAVPTSWRARTEDATGQTSPEELLAAAHACRVPVLTADTNANPSSAGHPRDATPVSQPDRYVRCGGWHGSAAPQR